MLPSTGVQLLGPMLLWFVATIVTAIACAALYYAAAGRMVNATGTDSSATNRHFQLALAGIDTDLASGRLGEAEATAAKGELARELIRQRGEVARTGKWQFERPMIIAAVAGVAVLALATYGLVGSPNLPGEPLADRTYVAATTPSMDQAVARVEAELAANPNDIRGWQVIGPVYMQAGRYADAVSAFRKVIALGDNTAPTQIDLAEAMIMQANGDASGEPLKLLQAAAALDPADARSRYYIAGELTRAADYPAAATAWRALLALSKGGEPWLETAQQGLAFTENGGKLPEATPPAQSDAIKGMVSGLADRLNAAGGSIEEWTRLVRSYLVLKDKVSAQDAYNKTVNAYPKAVDRAELDSVALSGGLSVPLVTP